MNEKDEFYKRDEDRRWRDRVNDRLASLTAGETVQDDRLENVEDLVDALDQTVRGARDDSRDGISARLKDQERLMRELRMVVIGKYDGDPDGLINVVSNVAENRPLKEKRLALHWKYVWGPLIGLGIASVGGFFFHDYLPSIKARAQKVIEDYRKADPYKSFAQAPSHSKRGGKKKKAVVKKKPVDVPEVPNEHQTDVSE